ncbi:MAG: hypothetical protein MZV65_50450 [Chromatiales bacterium]|nr:hypothetical protein [Chromatiales bacterium]
MTFLDEAAKRFPDVHLYPLRRDVFAATRLRKRDLQESAFEVLRYEAHQNMYQDGATEILRSLLPVYTFATLHVVDEAGKPQSGFCTYFFDAEHRLSDFNLQEATRANILGTGEAEETRRLAHQRAARHSLHGEREAIGEKPAAVARTRPLRLGHAEPNGRCRRAGGGITSRQAHHPAIDSGAAGACHTGAAPKGLGR